MTEAIVRGEYITFKHVKTRKVVILEIEIPEELFQDVITKLGMPIGGESKPVAVALLDKQIYNKPPIVGKLDIQQTEGEKLRTRAVLLCQDTQFNEYMMHDCGMMSIAGDEGAFARDYICEICEIDSRAELATNIPAQNAFKGILRNFDAWRVSNQYADNLSR